jgi:hypothetical protein
MEPDDFDMTDDLFDRYMDEAEPVELIEPPAKATSPIPVGPAMQRVTLTGNHLSVTSTIEVLTT